MRREFFGFRFSIFNLVSAALLFCLTNSSIDAAEDVPTITVSKGDQINLVISPLTGGEGATVTGIVQKDLTLSGLFKLGSANASYTVKGSAGSGALQGQVVDHSGGTILSKSYSGNTNQNAHDFANDIIETLTGNKGLAGSKIAFIATRSGRKEVYVADYDGSHVRQLTHDNTISVHPSLSVRGDRLAYTGYQSGYADVYLIDLVSGARNKIVNFPGTNSGAAFSPSADRIALTISKDGNPELYTVNVSGGGARRLTHTRGVESSPTWSPDGSEIIYSFDGASGPQLYRISSEGGSGQQISTGYGYCTEPSWSPDGKKVAFNVRSGGAFEIVVLELSNGSKRTVASGEDPAWGPDSRHLIFTEGGAIYMVDVINGRRNKILDGLGKITEPTWSR
jgi:TolB protein